MNLLNPLNQLDHVDRFDLGPKMELAFARLNQLRFDLIQGIKYSGLF